jgi:ferredoxin
MARKIDANACVGCGACSGNCPTEAISPQEDKYFVDSSKCTDCGACEDACPINAISAE